VVPVFLGSGPYFDRLRTAAKKNEQLRLAVDLERFRDFSGFLSHVQSLRSTCAVLDPFADGADGLETVLRLRGSHPHLALMVYTSSDRRRLADIAEIALAGVQELVTVDLDDSPTELGRAIARVARHGEEWQLLQLMERVTHHVGHLEADLIRCAWRVARTTIRAEALARERGISRRTLERRLLAAKLPSPENLLVRARVVRGVLLMRSRRWVLSDLSLELGWRHAEGFPRAVRRLTNLTPRQLLAVADSELLAALLIRGTEPADLAGIR
jgi:AraC-like DNA-binding protein